jgi:uncharacterized protein (TIGR01777 family)
MSSRNRTIVVAGGSGFLGRAVTRYMAARGWRVIVLSRRADLSAEGATIVEWDGRSLGPWASALDGADVLLNLAGRHVNCRYHARNRAQIERSRIDSTRALGQAIAAAKVKPRVWLNSSTATVYRHATDRPQDEFTGELGSGFSVNVAKAWEQTFFDAPTPGVRKVAMRTAMVMGRGRGGPFNVFRTLVRLRLGGRMASGKQFVSWIHIDDFCRAIEFLIQRDDLDGCLNLAAPNPLPNTDFMRALRRAAGVRFGLPASRWMLELGALVIRTETELPLKSRYVIPTRLTQAGFRFDFPDWPSAAASLIGQIPTSRCPAQTAARSSPPAPASTGWSDPTAKAGTSHPAS